MDTIKVRIKTREEFGNQYIPAWNSDMDNLMGKVIELNHAKPPNSTNGFVGIYNAGYLSWYIYDWMIAERFSDELPELPKLIEPVKQFKVGDIVRIKSNTSLFLSNEVKVPDVLTVTEVYDGMLKFKEILHFYPSSLFEKAEQTDTGIKESVGKVSYQEIDWQFITAMAERMNRNKGKYPPLNWQKDINIKEIQDALLRHVISVIDHSEDDPESIQEHLAAIGCNAMFLYYHAT